MKAVMVTAILVTVVGKSTLIGAGRQAALPACLLTFGPGPTQTLALALPRLHYYKQRPFIFHTQIMSAASLILTAVTS